MLRESLVQPTYDLGMKRKQCFLVETKKLQPFQRKLDWRKLVSFHICALENDIPARWNNVHSMSNTFDEKSPGCTGVSERFAAQSLREG